MAIQLLGSVSGVAADVNTNKELLVALSKDALNATPTYLVGKAHPDSTTNTGTITGSSQGMLAVGNAYLEMEENFVASTLNTAKWKLLTATMTGTVTSNVLTLNAGASVASGAYAILSTYRTFRTYRGSDRIFAWRLDLDFAPISNNVVEFGGGIVAAYIAPTAGAFFRYGNDGSLKGIVVSNAGAEITTADLISFVAGTTTDYHDFLVVVGQDSVVFEIDGKPVSKIDIAASAAAPAASESFPAFVRTYNSTLTTQAQKVNIGRMVTATLGGDTSMTKATICALAGDVSYQSVVGVGTGASTSNNTNGTAPPIATFSTTTPAATTLDGSLSLVGYAGSEVDNIIFGFQVPAATLTNMGRSLLIYSVTINMWVTAAPTNAALWQWQLAFGATAASLATAESASTKAYRRIQLGNIAFAAASPIGTNGIPITVNFPQPIAVNAGEFVSLLARLPVGTTTGSPSYRLTYTVNGSWE